MIHDSPNFASSKLSQKIETLPTEVKAKLKTAATQFLLSPGPTTWSGDAGRVESPGLSTLNQDIQLATVDEVTALVNFSMADEDKSKTIPSLGDLEICKFPLVNQSQTVALRESLCRREIDQGERAADIWEQRFSGLAKSRIKIVTIADRYALAHFFARSHGKACGLEKFILLLGRNSQHVGRSLTIYSAWTGDLLFDNQKKPLDKRDVLRKLESELRQFLKDIQISNLKIDVYLAPDSDFGDEQHDRHIRFDKYVWDIGTGVEIFEEPCAPRKTRTSFGDCFARDGYTKYELNLKAIAQRNRHFFRIT